MPRRFSKTWLALAGLVVIVLAIAWFLTRSTEAPALASDHVTAPVPIAQAPTSLAVGDVPAWKPPERTTATPGEGTAPAPPAAKAARPETLVYGSLLDESGEPIRGAWWAGVNVIDHDGRRRHADAKEEGAYAIHALPFGTYVVTAGAHGYREVEATLDLRPQQLVIRKDFTLPKSVVLKIKLVTPEGENLLARMKSSPRGHTLVPVATQDHPGARMSEVTGSLNNRFGVGNFWNYGPPVESLPPGYMGVVVLTCDLPVHVSLVNYHAVLATQRVEPGTDEVVFVMSPEALTSSLATIRLRTVDADTGDPIAGVRVMLSGTASSDMGSATDEKGVAILEGRAPGRFQMRLMVEDYEHLSRQIDAEPGQVTDLGDIALDKAVIVQGRLVDAEGKGVAAEFNFGVLDPASGAIDMDRTMQFATDATGAFALNGLGRKQYVLRTENHDALNDKDLDGVAWVSGNVFVNARAGPITGLEIQLHKAAMLVLRVKGESPDGLGFRVKDQDGRVLVASRFYGPGPRPLKLPPGSYAVALLDAQGNVLAQKSVTLGSQPVEVELAR